MYSQSPIPLKYKLQNTDELKPQDMYIDEYTIKLGSNHWEIHKIFLSLCSEHGPVTSLSTRSIKIGGIPVIIYRSPIPRTIIRHIEGDLNEFK